MFQPNGPLSPINYKIVHDVLNYLDKTNRNQRAEWEDNFIKSITEQLERTNRLSPLQLEKLEEIYVRY